MVDLKKILTKYDIGINAYPLALKLAPLTFGHATNKESILQY